MGYYLKLYLLFLYGDLIWAILVGLYCFCFVYVFSHASILGYFLGVLYTIIGLGR